MKKKEFDLLPNNEKRIAIARDVIEQLNKKLIIPASKYFESSSIKELLFSEEKSVSLKKLLPDHECEVCAMGALFVSDVLIRNNFNINRTNINDIDPRIIKSKLNYFSPYQLNLIEAAFEGLYISFPQIKNFLYHKDFNDREKRMIAIMQNIIDNDGDFLPQYL